MESLLVIGSVLVGIGLGLIGIWASKKERYKEGLRQSMNNREDELVSVADAMISGRHPWLAAARASRARRSRGAAHGPKAEPSTALLRLGIVLCAVGGAVLIVACLA